MDAPTKPEDFVLYIRADICEALADALDEAIMELQIMEIPTDKQDAALGRYREATK